MNPVDNNMNPFDNNIVSDTIITDNNLLKENKFVEIWIEERGRKVDTYISGLSIYTDEELKIHLQNMKKKQGCNGCIKELDKDDIKIKVLQLQGNKKSFLNDYFSDLGIKNIKLKG